MKTRWIFAVLVVVFLGSCNKEGKPGLFLPVRTDTTTTYLQNEATLNKLDSLHVLRDSCLRMYRLNEQSERYEEAFAYNEKYRFYKDSIAKIVHEEEIREIQGKYEQEKLHNIHIQLKIEKEKTQRTVFITLAIALSTLALIVLFYQWKLLHKERAIRRAKKQLEDYHEKIRTNESVILSNNEIIQFVTKQREQHFTLEEFISEQQVSINNMQSTNRQLLEENVQLTLKVKKYTHQLGQKGVEQSTYDQLRTFNHELQERDKRLTEQLLKRMRLINQLKQHPRALTQEQQKELIDETNTVYPGFSLRLHEKFPSLSDLDLLTCCLIKLRFLTGEIALLTHADAPASVTKRKKRIKEQLCEVQPDIWQEDPSLDLYIWRF